MDSEQLSRPAACRSVLGEKLTDALRTFIRRKSSLLSLDVSTRGCYLKRPETSPYTHITLYFTLTTKLSHTKWTSDWYKDSNYTPWAILPATVFWTDHKLTPKQVAPFCKELFFFQTENLKGANHLGNPGVDGEIKSNGGLQWTGYWKCGLHIRQERSWVNVHPLLPPQRGPCPLNFV